MQKGLEVLRKKEDEWEIEEAKLEQPLTIYESARQFLELYNTFASHLQETESLFASEREAYLVELQQRLQCLAKWQRKQNEELVSSRGKDSEAIK